MWTTDTFFQNLTRFSVLKGQGPDRPTVVGMDPGLSGLTHSRRERPTTFDANEQNSTPIL